MPIESARPPSSHDRRSRRSPVSTLVITFAVLAGLIAAAGASGAQAQQPISYGHQAANPSGWIFNVAPYGWLASLDTTSDLALPPTLGGTISTDTSVGFGQLLSHLNFALMVAGDAQYGRFSVLTDFMYMNLGGTASHITSVNFAGFPSIPISTSVQTRVSMNLNAKIWTLAGGYTLVQDDWGNFDVIAGFRYLGIPINVNYDLALTLIGPRGNGATFGGAGSVSGTANIWNGIGGFRGRVHLGNTGLFIPYYFDAGAGSSTLTWQISSGVGYHSSWGDLSLTYRCLSFEQNSGALRHLVAKGPMIMANFSF
jgi:hypothetical protein